MNCDDLLQTLNEYVDGTIDPGVCEQFQQHLAECNPCRIVVDNIRKTIQLYKGDEVFEIPIEFHNRLHETLRKHWKPGKTDSPG
jgi:anti-sigma factor RsiW